ncbi:hypothetical protein ACIP5Y_15155 [Nocardia sp. NPDC088792]|uniref:hypothetical protein n=1 Tax=Nocardia sp. NPDC088792 TaxID=3364332 RepID=UPI0037FC9D07
MHDEGREQVTEYYPSKSGTIGALAFCLLMTALPAVVVFDNGETPPWRAMAGFTMLLFGFGVCAMAREVFRPEPTLVLNEHGFTYHGYPHVAWNEVEKLRLRVGRLRSGGREERIAEVVMRDPEDFRARVLALGDAAAKRAAPRSLLIVPERLPVPLDEVLEAMRRHHAGLLVAEAGNEPQFPSAPPRSADRDMVESALVSAFTDMLPVGWQFSVLWFSLVGDEGHAGIQVQLDGDDTDDIKPDEEVLTLLNRLKEVCYDQMTGTWLSGQIALKADVDEAQFKLSFKEIPDWLPVPDADECRRELAAYPRAGDEIPEWLRERIS